MRLGEGGFSFQFRAAAHRFRAFLRLLCLRQRLRAPLALTAAQNRPPQSRGRLSMSIDTWTPERVEQLQGFVVAGLSCSQIAAQIGVTRNAVIGKIHRLGLSPVRPPGAMARSCPPRARDPRAASPRRRLRLLWSDGGAVTPEVEGAPAAVESAEPCSLLDLAQGKCRWPVSDTVGGGTADFVFCGNAVIEGLSYCAGHARMAYRQSTRRRA
jgi:GcrA cell cycle regulator